MEDYKPHIFYEHNIKDLNDFKKDAVNYSYYILCEQKYKNGMNHREKSELTLEETLKRITCDDDIKIVHRKPNFGEMEHFQVAFMNDWYFAWCDIDMKHEDYFIKKYDLKKVKL